VELYETDLGAFLSDLGLAGRAPTTIEQYERFLRRWRSEAAHTPTARGVKDWLATQTPWNAYMAARALRRYVRWYAAEYDTEDWSREIP
jgi:hypothetical protein